MIQRSGFVRAVVMAMVMLSALWVGGCHHTGHWGLLNGSCHEEVGRVQVCPAPQPAYVVPCQSYVQPGGPGGYVSVPYRPVYPPGSLKLNVINNVLGVVFVNIGTNDVVLDLTVKRQQQVDASGKPWDDKALYTGEQGSAPLDAFGPGPHTFTAYGRDETTGEAVGVATLRVAAGPLGSYRYLGPQYGFGYDGVPSLEQGSITWIIERLDPPVTREEASRRR